MRGSRALPAALAAATFLALFATQADVGFVRDEGYYFTAAQNIEAWLRLFFHAPAQAIAQTETYFAYNFEHPGLAKLLFALSHLVFRTWLEWLPDALAWRLPAFAFGALLSYWLATLGLARSPAAAALAPALFWCAERTFFHGHLACFDVPICALIAGTGVAWARALGVLGATSTADTNPTATPTATATPNATATTNPTATTTPTPTTTANSTSTPTAGAVATAAPTLSTTLTPADASPTAAPALRTLVGLACIYGCALSVKHNAWLLPPVLLIHALLLPRGLRARALRTLPWLLLAPIVLFLSWPLLWHDPFRHLADWGAFHRNHVHYAWYYLGQELRAPPFPTFYPAVVLALALPLPAVALFGAALVRMFVDVARRRLGPLRLLELGLALAAVLPFMLRTTPVFGGIKHWLAFPALLAPEAAHLVALAAAQAAAAVPWLRRGRRAIAIASAAALLPGLHQIAHVHPYGTSAYGELAGGIPGAASLGMQRQYWSNNVTAVLPWLNAYANRRARIYFHEVNIESFRAYQQAGLLRKDLAYAADLADADYAAIQWHREFRDREPEAWNRFGTRRPVFGFYLDETPQVVVYGRAVAGR